MAISTIPRIQTRLELLSFKMQFPQQLKELVRRLFSVVVCFDVWRVDSGVDDSALAADSAGER